MHSNDSIMTVTIPYPCVEDEDAAEKAKHLVPSIPASITGNNDVYRMANATIQVEYVQAGDARRLMGKVLVDRMWLIYSLILGVALSLFQ